MAIFIKAIWIKFATATDIRWTILIRCNYPISIYLEKSASTRWRILAIWRHKTQITFTIYQFQPSTAHLHWTRNNLRLQANLAQVGRYMYISSAGLNWSLCFYTCLSVILFPGGGVCLSACWDTHSPRSRPPGADTPWEADTPTLPGKQTPPPAVHAGRYGPQAGGTHPAGMYTCFEMHRLWRVTIIGQGNMCTL